MTDQFSKPARLTMTILAVLFGLFVIVIAPLLIHRVLNELMQFVSKHGGNEPGFKLALTLLPTFIFIFRGISVVAGITLITLAVPLWKGEAFAWPVAMVCIGLPTMFSVLFVLPYVAEIGKPPVTLLVLIIGLLTYLVFMFLKKGTGMEKLARFLSLTLLGMLPGHASILVVHGLRALLSNPDKPVFPNPKIAIFGFEGPINFIVMVFCVVSIYLIAARKKAGWYLALIAGLAAVVADYPTHFIRMETSDFFVGGTLGLLLVIVMLIPAFRKRLVVD